MSLKAFSKRNPCPICNGGSDCRYTPDETLILCHGFIYDDPSNPDWHYLGVASSEVWGKFVPRRDRRDYDPDKSRQARIDRELKQQAEKLRKAEQALGIADRDRAIKVLAAHFGLSRKHRDDLEKRGLTPEQIEQGLFFTIQYGEPVPRGIPWNLPGVKDGKLSNADGLACPSFNTDGLATGYQVRADKTDDAGKYRWAKGEVSSHLPNGELPLTIINNSNPKDLWLVEGILKPWVASAKHGINCLGAAGGNFSGSPSQVRKVVAGYDRLIVALDAGDLKNPHTKKRWQGQISFLRSLGLPVVIAYWGQGYSKHCKDIDELSDLSQISYLDLSELFPESDRAPNGLAQWLNKLLGGGKKNQKRRDNPKPTIYLFDPEKAHPFPTREQWESWGRPVIQFPEGGDRAAVINAAIAAGHRHLWDRSFMGAGKSHSVPDLTNPNPDGKIYYISQDHRNPTVEGIRDNFTDLIPRTKHGFTYQGGRLVESGGGGTTPLAIAPNCHRAPMFRKVYLEGHQVFTEEGGNPICGTCPKLNQCRATGYLNQRARALKNQKIRADINGLDRFTDYSGDILAIDELKSLPASKQIASNHTQRLLELDILRVLLNHEIYSYLDSAIQTLKALGQGNTGKYGLTTEEIRKALPTHPYLGEIIEFLETSPLDLSEYFVEPDSVRGDKQYKGLARLVNRYLSREATKETLDKLEQLPPNSLINLLKLIAGDNSVQANLRGEYLTLTVDNRFYTPILEQATAVIILDATATPERLELKTGIAQEKWLVIQEKVEKPLGNLTINQIEVEGWGSNNPSEVALGRVNVLLDSLGRAPTLGFKKHLETLGLAGYLFYHNIGSNAFAGIPVLNVVGTPAPNYGQVRDEFLALGGDIANFPAYYQSLIDEQILQTCGRQRCHRYPEQQFTLNWLGTNLDLTWLEKYGATVNRVSAYEVNPAAGSETQLIKTSYLEATRCLVEKGIKVTQERLAALVGKAQSTISENLNRWGVTLDALAVLAQKIIGWPIDTLYRPPDNPDYRDFLGLDPLEEIVAAIEAIAVLGWENFLTQVFTYFPKALQLKLLGYLIATTEIPAPE